MDTVKDKPFFVKDFVFKNEFVEPVKPKISKSYPIPISMYNDAQALVDQYVKEGRLEKIESASYTLPAFFKRKPNGGIRMLFNAKDLNKHLARRAVHMPGIVAVQIRP